MSVVAAFEVDERRGAVRQTRVNRAMIRRDKYQGRHERPASQNALGAMAAAGSIRCAIVHAATPSPATDRPFRASEPMV
jgi:hypothetical protein